MKKIYTYFFIIITILMTSNVKALQIKDCQVLATFKQNSSTEEEKYICKGIAYGKNTDPIYYDGENNIIRLNNFNGYYLSNQENIEINITGTNNISLLHLENKIKVTGTGNLKFKESSYAMLLSNGESVYRYLYKDKVLLEQNKIYTGTELEFQEKLQTLQEENNLPDNFQENITKELIKDYNKISTVVITDSWFTTNVETTLTCNVSDGFGLITYIEPPTQETKPEPIPETPKKNKTTKKDTFEKDNIVFITKKAVNSKYTLHVDDIKETKVGESVSETLEDSQLIMLYDIGVYNGKKEINMNNGEYTIKIKKDDNFDLYEDYKIIYVNKNGEIEEYINSYEEDGYLIFNTTHLSQYGIVGTKIKPQEPIYETKKINYTLIIKLTFLISFTIISIALITFIFIKSQKYKNKKRKSLKK